MKTFWFTLSFAIGLALNAQTNVPPPTTIPEPSAPGQTDVAQTSSLVPTNAVLERPPTEISSESAKFNLKTRVAVYIGHVRVVDPQMRMTCDLMTAMVPESGRITNIVAEQNVVIDAVDGEGKPVHATSNRAVYTYQETGSETNELIVLSGNPEVKSQMFSGTGDTITWDRTRNTVRATNQRMFIQASAQARTNTPPATIPENRQSPRE